MGLCSEENVWQLVAKAAGTGTAGAAAAAGLRVVFVSNARRAVPLWHQASGDPDRDGLVIWVPPLSRICFAPILSIPSPLRITT